MARIALQGARNIRDLGGFVTSAGRKTVHGRLLRGDALSRLEDVDVAVLGDLGLRVVIDFRGPKEIDDHGADRLPPGASVVNLPITGGNIGAALAAAGGDPHAQNDRALEDGKAAQLMIEANRQFVADPGYRDAFGAAFRLIADPGRQPALFHCTAGKDRTGWMAAIVLTVLGVPREAVIADYLATNDYVWTAYESWLQRLVDSGELADINLVKPLLFQDRTYLEAAFDEADTRYGSFDRFLVDGLGLTTTDLDRLREVLLD